MRELREWISEKMRRRSRRGPNESESTGKSGQELPSNQPAPLRPSHPEPLPARQPAAARTDTPPKPPAPANAPKYGAPTATPPAPEKKMVLETQPDSLGT